jgi:hypothetical protein
LYKLLISGDLNLAVVIHFGAFSSKETVSVARELLADSRYNKGYGILQDLRRVKTANLHDTDRAFVEQSKKYFMPFMNTKIAILYDPDNPVNGVHDERRNRFEKGLPQPDHLQCYTLSKAAECLGVGEQDLGLFIQRNFDSQE